MATNSPSFYCFFDGLDASSDGAWSRLLIAFIAFLCIFGTTITVIDGYSRANNETMRLLFGRKEASQKALNVWMVFTSIIGIIIVLLFAGDVATLMRFAMIASFLTTPVYAYLNYSLVNNKEHKLSVWLNWLSIFGLIYLAGFAIFFLVYITGLLS